MPKVQLPHSAKGWVMTMVASMVGFITGVVSLAWLERIMK